MRRHLRGIITAACALSVAGCAPQLSFDKRSIIDGTPDPGHPTVAKIDITYPDQSKATCSGNLIAPKTVVTAAHCVLDNVTYSIEIDGVTHNLADSMRHPDYDPQDTSPPLTHDIGLMMLAEASTVPPMPISRSAPFAGQALTIVGYGRTVPSDKDTAGVKHFALNTVENITTTYFSYDGTGSGEGSACFGDSGGAVLATVGGNLLQLGVTSSAIGQCGSETFNPRLDYYEPWLTMFAGPGLVYEDIDDPLVSLSVDASTPETAEVDVTVADDSEIVGVALIVDGQTVATLTAEPYRHTLSLPGGTHTIRAEATDSWQHTGFAEQNVVIAALPIDAGVPDVGPVAGDGPVSGGGCAVGGQDLAPLWLLLALAIYRKRALP